MAKITKTKRRLSAPSIYIYSGSFLIGVMLFAYWDRNDPAEFPTDIGALCISIPMLITFYALVAYFTKKKSVAGRLQPIKKYTDKLAWAPPVTIFVLSVFYIFPYLTHTLLNNYGVREQAVVTDHYYTYEVAPFNINGIFAGAKKTDEFNATTEVVKYRTTTSRTSGTIDFPYNAYDQSREAPINQLIRHNRPIVVVYLRYLSFISEPVTHVQ